MSQPHVPHAPAPGTPVLPLAVLLDAPGLGLTLVAGPRDDRLIGTIGTTELPEPAPYLYGGELLLTAGVRFPPTAEAVDAYVRSVVEAGVAALGFGVAPVYDEVPAVLVEACERHRLPLVRVPPATPFVAVNRAAYQFMAEARSRDLREVSEAQSALASAAGRPDPLPAVLHQLAARLGAWAALFDAGGQELFTAGTRPGAPAPRQLRELAARTSARAADRGPGAPPAAAAEHAAGRHLTVHTLPGGLALGLAAEAPPTGVHRSVTGVAAVLLSLLTSPRHALGADSSTAGALVRLLLGGAPADAADLLHPGGSWVVVRGRRGRPGPEADPVRLAALGTALGTPYLDVSGTSLLALVPGAGPADPDAAARLGWTLGVSAPAGPDGLPHAATHAERALRRALAAGLPAARQHTEALSVHALVDEEDARAHAEAVFAPLAGAAAPGAAVLLETLRTWLAHHGSWDRTAAALELHRNTVRQRIARTGELLGADLSDADVRMELWFALRRLPGERPRRT
ncbi:PucR family transcriptional regulator ligand-binding domain-containing protein [Kitasatospora sp. NPDC059571]|uniref:PucR family transcriptional regulator ligand-binding domain-containing protein n=1 Tax=Kitasatospora sp. NPDC059571 TaxID=3346871 RepID=UPI0036AFE404